MQLHLPDVFAVVKSHDVSFEASLPQASTVFYLKLLAGTLCCADEYIRLTNKIGAPHKILKTDKYRQRAVTKFLPGEKSK